MREWANTLALTIKAIEWAGETGLAEGSGGRRRETVQRAYYRSDDGRLRRYEFYIASLCRLFVHHKVSLCTRSGLFATARSVRPGNGMMLSPLLYPGVSSPQSASYTSFPPVPLTNRIMCTSHTRSNMYESICRPIDIYSQTYSECIYTLRMHPQSDL